jgi:hypothetical protein
MAEIINLPPPPEPSEEEWYQFFQEANIEPWVGNPAEIVPSNREWNKTGRQFLPAARMAVLCAMLSKDKLTEFVGEMMQDRDSFERLVGIEPLSTKSRWSLSNTSRSKRSACCRRALRLSATGW